MRPSGSRKLWFTLLAAIVGWIAVELGSFLLLSAVEGRWTTYSRIRALRVARLEAGGGPAPAERDPVVGNLLATSVIHPFLGYVRDPASVPLASFNAESQQFGFIQNRHSLFAEPEPDQVVVAVTGGSVARSVAVHGDALRRALAKSRRFAGRRPIVLSLATGGYKQPQQLMTLAWVLALGTHVDMVVNLDGFNDVVLAPASNVPSGVFAFYPFQWDLRVGHLDLDRRRRIGELTYLRERRRDWARLCSRAPWRWSMAAALVWKSLDSSWAGRIARAEEALAQTAAEDDYQARGPRRAYPDENLMYRDLADVWAQSSYQMHLLCRGMGIEYHHFLQPNQYVPGTKPRSDEEKKTAWLARHPFRKPAAQGYRWLIRRGRELRQEGVAFHDLTRIFVGNRETLYADTCCHLNRQGNDLLAAAIGRAIDGESGD